MGANKRQSEFQALTDVLVVGGVSVRLQAAICLILAAFCIILYETTTYGGIRSPDSEIVFRSSEALVSHGSVAIEQGLEWKGFGLAKGVDGKEYSIFGLGQVLAAAPLVVIGRSLAETGFFSENTFPIPISFYEDDGLQHFSLGQSPPDRNNQGVRWVAAQLNIVISALTVVLFYLTAFRLAGNPAPALFAALIYGFGTLVWPYSGTFFSEPLATLFGLAAFYLLLINDPSFGTTSSGVMKTLLAGACLGIATATHLSAILFTPFFFLYALYPYFGPHQRSKILTPAVGFVSGLAAMLALLGYYNYVRFGSPLETGRTVDPMAAVRFGYGVFTNPIEGLYGLLLSSNKGLVLFSPVVVVGALAWPRLHRLHRFLAYVLAAAVVFRIVFIASRSDWHGGFSLGPRYLVMILPYLCLPLALLVKDLLQNRRYNWYLFATSVVLFVCQQFYFSLGEIFSYYFQRMWQARNAGINIFAGHRIYFEWTNSSVTSLLDGFRGPFLLRQLQINNYTLFLLGCSILTVVGILIYVIILRTVSVVKAHKPQYDANGVHESKCSGEGTTCRER